MPNMSRPSRRTLNAMLLAAASSTMVGPRNVLAEGASPTPFRIDIPQATIDRILGRVREAQWPDRLDTSDWRYGTNWDYMKTLATYWAEQYDWRKAEENLNRYPQFRARVGDFDIHFYHVKGRGPRPVPLILTHGWPGSVFEFLEAIGPLSDPASFGGSPDDAFDVVVPSLPGYGFSSRPKGKPVGPGTTAALWNQLMRGVLGYPKYGAQGGDWGGIVTVQLGRAYSDSAPLPPEPEQTPEERAYARALTAYRAAELDYASSRSRVGDFSLINFD
jgi:epoxide hydrolase